MSELMLWKTEEIDKLRRDLDRLFDRCWCDFGIGRFLCEVSEGFSLQVRETEDSLMVKAELKGVNPENLDVSITNDIMLTIKGQKKIVTAGENGYYHSVKRRFTSFKRTLRLPCRVRVGEIRATYEKGILKIIMPKWKPQKARGIKVEIHT